MRTGDIYTPEQMEELRKTNNETEGCDEQRKSIEDGLVAISKKDYDTLKQLPRVERLKILHEQLNERITSLLPTHKEDE